MPFIYKDIKIEIGYRIDLLIENKVIPEVKSIESLAPGALFPVNDIAKTFR
jgi:hypothetical protein